MKFTKTLFVLIFSFLATIAFSQDVQFSDISGKVIDKKTEDPVSFANVALYDNDSALVTGAVTNEKGEFKIKAKPGKYYVEVKFISYESVNISDFKLAGGNNVNLGNIFLSPDTETLEEVVVAATKTQMKLELDKRIFNIGSTLSNSGANASEVLSNLPGITVDVDGNVNLRGSQNVRILINGKPSGLAGLSSTDALRQLQGNLIEKVEVITNPSARYDAEGTAGIINIVLKKDRRKGFNGSFSGTAGYPDNYQLSGSLNYRTEDFNFFGNYGLGYRRAPGEAWSDQFFDFPDTTYSTLRQRDFNRGGISNTFRFGADYYITDKDILTGSFLTRISDETNTTNITYSDFNSQDDLIAEILREDIEKEDDDVYEFEINYEHQFEGEDHKLTAAVQYRNNYEVEDSEISELPDPISNTNGLFQNSLNKQGDTNLMIQADYVNPFSEKKKFEAGYRGTIRTILSDFRVEERPNEETPWEVLPNFTNNFQYDETVHALYSIFENKYDKWGYQLGLRMESTYIRTFQEQTNEESVNNYINLFPSIFLTYKLTDFNSLQTSYSRRISRPRYWYLNPFYSFSDPRNLRTGNIYLQPEFTDSYEAGFLSNRKKVTYYLGAYYRFTTGVIQRINIVSNDGVTISQPQNLSTQDSYGFEGNFNYDPFKWMNITGNANFYRATISGSYLDQDLSSDTYTSNFRLSTQFKIKENNLQIIGFYNSPMQIPQGIRNGFYSIDLGFNRDVFEGNGTLSLAVRDLFNTLVYGSLTSGDNFVRESFYRRRFRQMDLTFTYRVNQQKKRGSRGGGNYGSSDY